MKIIEPFPHETHRPVIYSAKNKWKGEEMYTVSEFCFIIDKAKPKHIRDHSLFDVLGIEFKPEP